jgi:hypothetical protein
MQFSIGIAAPVGLVFQTFHDPDGYRHWTSAFCEGSYCEGRWEQGGRLRFLSPSGDGMVAEVAAFRADEYISLRLLGWIVKGIEDTESAAVKAWTPAYENYTFQNLPEGTRLLVEQDVLEEYVDFMSRSWPNALTLLKERCEGSGEDKTSAR